jgi:hypothetical protein
MSGTARYKGVSLDVPRYSNVVTEMSSALTSALLKVALEKVAIRYGSRFALNPSDANAI